MARRSGETGTADLVQRAGLRPSVMPARAGSRPSGSIGAVLPKPSGPR
jgi:hypothetical protein